MRPRRAPAEAQFPPPRYPIAGHGLISDGCTAALAHSSGALTWLCAPRFDSPALFAALLDAERGGACEIHPLRSAGAAAAKGRQRYLPRTNILVTEFAGGARVTDWMPVRGLHSLFRTGAVCRLIEAPRGEERIFVRCGPRLEYGRVAPRWRRNGAGPARRGRGASGARGGDSGPWWSAAGELGLHVSASDPLALRDGDLVGTWRVAPGRCAWLVISWGEAAPAFLEEGLRRSLLQTRRAWETWASRAQYAGPNRELVIRSALALKALIYEPTGAIVAAPTTSLPEWPGGTRNWDYRFCWPRDSSFALYGLSLLGYHEEASRFLHFIAELADSRPLPLQVCYRVDGSAELPERSLPGLAGYAGSRPVREGNAAAGQFQLDIYGEVLDAAYTYAKWRGGLERDIWRVVVKLANFVAGHWRRPDNGIWEVRGGPRQFVYSKAMCWVALDRALKLARIYRLPAPIGRWSEQRAALRGEIIARGYNSRLHSFVQSYGADVVDSSLLLLPLVRFLHPRDPRMEATIRNVRAQLGRGRFLLRYANTREDGVGGDEGAFLICGFWLIDCLTLLGDTRASRRMFNELVGCGSPLGLFSEEADWSRGTEATRLLGNFPQAFTHMALINAAHNLELYPKGVP